MPVFISTPSTPSSIAMAASEAVPTPASTMSGTSVMQLAQNANAGLVLQSQSAADGRTQRHDRARAGIDQTLGDDDVVRGIGQHGEAFLHQHAGGFDRGLHVGKQRGLIADDLDLHPVRTARLRAPDVRCEWLRRRCSSRRCWAAESICCGSMKSSSDSLLRSRFTRRTATVTISAPEASMARAVSCPERYFPVPTIRRERNCLPAMMKESIEIL